MSIIFVREAIRKFKTQGSLFPSTSSLGRRMVRPLRFRADSVIVELGAGTGVITREIIAKMPTGARLVVFENNQALAALLQRDLREEIERGAVILVQDDAAAMPGHLQRLGLGRADHVLSGLPLGNFNHGERQRIFDAIKAGMADDGVFIQFQYLLASLFHIRKDFDARVIAYELRNIPPAFVYKCTKK